MIVKIQETDRTVRVVRKYRPRNGGGVTLGEFSDRARAERYIAQKGHEVR